MGLTAAQLEARRSALGASDAAAVLGVSRRKSAWRIWMDKRGLLPPEAPSWDMERGLHMEALILRWYAQQMRVDLATPDTIYHPSVHCVLAHCDAIATGAVDGRLVQWPVEAKDVKGNMARYWGQPWTDQCDPEYYPQATVQMECTVMPWCDVVVSIGGAAPSIYRVPRRPQLGEKVIHRLGRWWGRHMIADEPVPVDSSDVARHWLGTFYDLRTARMLQATAELEDVLALRSRLAAELRAGKKDKDRIDNFVRAIISNDLGIQGAFGKVTWPADCNGQRRLVYAFAETIGEDDDTHEGEE